MFPYAQKAYGNIKTGYKHPENRAPAVCKNVFLLRAGKSPVGCVHKRLPLLKAVEPTLMTRCLIQMT